MKNLETLQNEHRELLTQLRESGSSLTNRDKSILAKIRENETQTKVLKIQYKLDSVNKNQSRLRDLAKIAWNCEQPNEDITTDSGYFHKTKVKKYPNLAALTYAHAKFEGNIMYILTINGEKFYMYERKYDYNKPDEYTRPATFEEFLNLNSIQLADITGEELAAIVRKNEELTQKFKAFHEELQSEYKKLNMYALSNLTLFSQDMERVYNYRLNY